MYNTAANVTGVLIARATGMSFGVALRERICGPLGMKDTGFSVTGESVSRLATVYQRDDATGEIVILDGPDGQWSRPPEFEDAGGGLVSTISDYLAFATALLAGGTPCRGYDRNPDDPAGTRATLRCRSSSTSWRPPTRRSTTDCAAPEGNQCSQAREELS
jgi:CubicO group peptidase (beta-lactamase class C family)